MTSVGKENKTINNRDRQDYYHHMPMLPLLGANHRLMLLYVAKCFIWIEETGGHVYQFDIGYMINPSLYLNKTFKEQVEKCMNTIFGELTQPFIETRLSKKIQVCQN